jgi:hypothetical protein
MDTSKFKDVVQNILKNYSSLLVPAVIGVVAVLLFIPTQLISGKLRAQIEDESVRQRGNKIRSSSAGLVTRDRWKQETAYQGLLKDDANEIALLAKQSTERELLSYKIFPEPKVTSVLIFQEFSQRFLKAVDGLLGRINASDCPSDVELERGLEGLPTKSRSGTAGRSSRLSGWQTSSSRLREAKATIEDILCIEKAESAFIYANQTDLSGYEFWKEYEAKGWADGIEDCWYWQLGYWIIEDIIDTVDFLNSGSANVFTSPVKRLMSVSFPASGKRFRFKARTGSGERGADDKPKYVFSVEDGLAGLFTERISSGDVDVVHFNVVVVVSAKAILPFMQELCSAKSHKFKSWDGKGQEQVFKRNQITILESKIESINREDIAHERYRYGDDAVVKLDLVCEYIFNKAAYDKVKPESVKESIKQILEEQKKKKAKATRRTRRTKPGATTKGPRSRKRRPLQGID